MNKTHKNFSAFTLSEILIALGIIGIIAALTVPNIIQNYKDKQTVSKLKKAYSTLSQAYNLSTVDDNTPENWNLINKGNATGAVNMLHQLSNSILQLKICDTDIGCFPDVIYKSLDGRNRANINRAAGYGKAIVNDGMLMYTWIASKDCTANYGKSKELKEVCAAVTVDINGFKNPNTYGKDLFSFWITKKGIIPQGIAEDSSSIFGGGTSGRCSMAISHSENGSACAAWVIMNENLDYTHCYGLAWGGKTTCK